MAESSTPKGKGKKDKNKKILIGLGIVVVGIAIWLLMRRKKASNIFLNITNYSASNYAPLSEAQVKSELEKANALVESKGVDGAITDLQSQVATLEAQGTPESLALAKLLKDFIADLKMQKENQTKSLTGGASSGSMGGSQPMAVTANVNDPQFAPLTPAQVQNEVDSTNASLIADGLPNTIKSINDRITALSGSTNPQDIAQVKLLQYLLEQLTSQSISAVTIDTANNSYAPLTPTQIKAEVDSTNASLSTNGVQSTLDTLNSRINQLSGSTNPSDIAMSRLLQNLASQLSGLTSSSGTPYSSTSSSMGLPSGMTMGGTSMSGATMGSTTSGMTMSGIPYSPTTMSMGLPTTMTPSTMLNIPPPAPAVPSLSNPIIHTCGTYTSWYIAGYNIQTAQPDPRERTGEELSLAARFGGGNRVHVNVLPTNGLPSIVPFMLVKLTVTVINKSNIPSKIGFDIGFTNPNNTTSATTSYGYLKGIKMFTISKEEIGTTGAIFTLSGVVPSQGGNQFYIQPDNSLIPYAEWQSFDIKVKVQTGGCVSGAVVNSPLNISTGTMLGSGSVNDLLAPTRPTTTTTTPNVTTTPSSSMTSMVNNIVNTITNACKYFSNATYISGSGLALGANVGNAFTIVLNNATQGRYGSFKALDSNGNSPIGGQTYRIKLESDIPILGGAPNTGAFKFGSDTTTMTTFNYTSITPTTPIEFDIVWGGARADGFNGFSFRLPSWGLGTKTGNLRLTISTLACVVPQPTTMVTPTTTIRPVATTSPIPTTTTTIPTRV